jgi:hypothetical protein
MGRIFTFGCSFTSYNWITWADIICYGNRGINLGQTGGGYDQILNKLIWATNKYKINENDTVVIMYPSLIRWDINNLSDGDKKVSTWSCWGQTTSSDLVKYQYSLWTEESLIHRSLNTILAIKSFLEVNQIPHITTAMFDVFKYTDNYIGEGDVNSDIKDHMDYVKGESPLDVIDFKNYLIPESDEWDRKGIYKFGGEIDYHPTIIEHVNWLDDILIPRIGYDRVLDDKTIIELDEKVKSMSEFNHARVNHFFEKKTNLFYQKQDTRVYFDDEDITYPNPQNGIYFNLR